jgi:DNA-directed RNA polymerase subunit alpha
VEDFDSEKVTVNITGQEEFTAGDINKFMTGFRVLNPKLVICRMEPDVKLHLEITISKGRGYVLQLKINRLKPNLALLRSIQFLLQ